MKFMFYTSGGKGGRTSLNSQIVAGSCGSGRFPKFVRQNGAVWVKKSMETRPCPGPFPRCGFSLVRNLFVLWARLVIDGLRSS